MATIVRLAVHAMATRFELVLAGRDEVALRAAGEAAIAEIEDCDRRLSSFRRDSLVTHLGRLPRGEPRELDADAFALFETCDEVRRASGGAFDVGLGALLAARGFRGAGHGAAEPTGVESSTPPYVLDPRRRTISLVRPGATLDLGGVAKGFALDLAARVLREVGVDTALLHGGTSTVVAIGAPPGMPGWRVAVEGGRLAPVACLRDEALSVSASDGRVNARGEGHVLDPRTGQSAPPDAAAVTLAPDATSADAWSTALLVTLDAAALPAPVRGFVGRGVRGARSWSQLPAGVEVLPAAPELVHVSKSS